MRISIYAADETGASGVWSGSTATPDRVKCRVIDSTENVVRNVTDLDISDGTWSVSYTSPGSGDYTLNAQLRTSTGQRLTSKSVMFTVA